MRNEVILIGYSGHAYVAFDIFESKGKTVIGYCEKDEKKLNPYGLKFFGYERDGKTLIQLKQYEYFIAIGDNALRKNIFTFLTMEGLRAASNALHRSSTISGSAQLGKGVMVSAHSVINAQAVIGDAVICNTGCVIEHECIIGSYSHIAPSATLCGNVTVGDGSFIGANSVVKEGVKIGSNVIVGAGSVIIKDVADNSKIVGSPQRQLK